MYLCDPKRHMLWLWSNETSLLIVSTWSLKTYGEEYVISWWWTLTRYTHRETGQLGHLSVSARFVFRYVSSSHPFLTLSAPHTSSQFTLPYCNLLHPNFMLHHPAMLWYLCILESNTTVLLICYTHSHAPCFLLHDFLHHPTVLCHSLFSLHAPQQHFL